MERVRRVVIDSGRQSRPDNLGTFMALDRWLSGNAARYLSAAGVVVFIIAVSVLLAMLSGKSSLGAAITILIV